MASRRPCWTPSRVALRQLWEYFARYPYLPRLRDEQVLKGAVEDGIGRIDWQDQFAYAEGWDEGRQRYLGLKVGETGGVRIDSQSLLVRPEAALRQLEQEKPPEPGDGGLEKGEDRGGGTVIDGPQPLVASPGPDRRLRRFYGTVTLDPLRTSTQADKIATEIVQHLSSLMRAQVTVTLEIHADLPEGVPENVVRTVTENAKTLKFDDFGFEEV